MKKITLHGNVEHISQSLARKHKCGGAVERKEKINLDVGFQSMSVMKIMTMKHLMRMKEKINLKTKKSIKDANVVNSLVIRWLIVLRTQTLKQRSK